MSTQTKTVPNIFASSKYCECSMNLHLSFHSIFHFDLPFTILQHIRHSIDDFNIRRQYPTDFGSHRWRVRLSTAWWHKRSGWWYNRWRSATATYRQFDGFAYACIARSASGSHVCSITEENCGSGNIISAEYRYSDGEHCGWIFAGWIFESIVWREIARNESYNAIACWKFAAIRGKNHHRNNTKCSGKDCESCRHIRKTTAATASTE